MTGQDCLTEHTECRLLEGAGDTALGKADEVPALGFSRYSLKPLIRSDLLILQVEKLRPRVGKRLLQGSRPTGA